MQQQQQEDNSSQKVQEEEKKSNKRRFSSLPLSFFSCRGFFNVSGEKRRPQVITAVGGNVVGRLVVPKRLEGRKKKRKRRRRRTGRPPRYRPPIDALKDATPTSKVKMMKTRRKKNHFFNSSSMRNVQSTRTHDRC